MFNNNTVDAIRFYMDGLMKKATINDAIEYLYEYLEYTSERFGDSYTSILEQYLQSSIISQKQTLKSFAIIEDYLAQLADVLGLDDDNNNLPLPSDVPGRAINWDLSHLYKNAFTLFPRDYNLTYESSKDRMKTKDECSKEYHLLLLYHYRNVLGHHGKEENINSLSIDEIKSITTSMLYVLLYMVNVYHEKLEPLYKKRIQRKYDIEKYIGRIKSAYISNLDFIYLDIKWDVNYSSTNCFTIDEIIDDSISDSIVAFIGEAGTGKTTALRRLEYQYAKKCKKNSFRNMPVFIELKHLRQSSRALMNAVCESLGVEEDIAEDIIKNEQIVLLLDGFNEIIDKQFAASIKKEIENLVSNNQGMKLYITDRTNKDMQFSSIKRTSFCLLHELSLDDKISYFYSNCHNEKSKELIEKEIQKEETGEYKQIFNSLKTPFMLFVFLKYVDENEEIPQNPYENYIQKLFDREKNEQKDNDDPKYFDQLKTVLGATAHVFENREFKKIQMERLIGKIKVLFGYNHLDSIECIELSVKMGILEVLDNEYIHFKTYEFYDYFGVYAIYSGLDEYLEEIKSE